MKGSAFMTIRQQLNSEEIQRRVSEEISKKEIRFKKEIAERCKIDIEKLKGETPAEDIAQAKAIMAYEREKGKELTREQEVAVKWINELEQYANANYDFI